jgi:hypothetical protein
MIVTSENGNTFELKKTVMVHKKIVGGNGSRYRAYRQDLKEAIEEGPDPGGAVFYYEFLQPNRKRWDHCETVLESYGKVIKLGCMYFNGNDAIRLRRWITQG